MRAGRLFEDFGMRAKFALIVAVASFMLVTALGTALAGAEPLGEGAPVDPAAATTTTAVPSLQAPACANGIDDDGDGVTDTGDADCESSEDPSEAGSTPVAPEPSESEPVPAPTPDPGTKPSGGVEQGTGIGGGGAGNGSGGGKGVSRNDELEVPGGGNSGGVSAPSANGGGDQPLPDGPDGGSQYSDGGSPTVATPTTTIAPFGPAPIGVPNFVIDSF